MARRIEKSDSLTIDVNKLSAAFKNYDLCTRCGTCIGICPENALYLNADLFPEISVHKCTSCGLCGKACPGETVIFNNLALQTFNKTYDLMDFDGFVTSTKIAYSINQKIRDGGAGGGVVTAILWDMLKSGEIDGCIVTRMHKDYPWLGEPFIARNYNDLLQSMGSRYVVIPLNSILQTIRSEPGKFAVAALPCHIHGLRNAIQKVPWLRRKITVLIGLFCGGALEPQVITDLLRTKGLKTKDISDFQFRGGEWPGMIRAVTKNGEIINMHYSNYKDGAYNYFIGLYMPTRCQTCIDGSNEFADFSVSDSWTKNEYGEYIYKNTSRILLRTVNGSDVVNRVLKRGSLHIVSIDGDDNYKSQKLHSRRKGITAPLRVERLRAKGIAVPIYDKPVPIASWNEMFMERAVSLILSTSKSTRTRFYIIKFLTSYYAIPLIKLRLWLKNRKYKKRKNENPRK